MKKIILLLFTMPLFIYFLTCDRADMQTIAKYGPEPDVIYLFSDGAAIYDGAFTGYDGPEEACYIQYESYFTNLDITRIEPLLSTHERDVRDIVPDVYSHVKVVGALTPTTTISNSWDGLWDGTIDTALEMPVFGGTAPSYWTGSTGSGTLYSTFNCDNWSVNEASHDGFVGDGTQQTNGWWITANDVSCVGPYSLICVGY